MMTVRHRLVQLLYLILFHLTSSYILLSYLGLSFLILFVQINSFQLVLAYDDCKSFALFNYGELGWTKGLLSDTHAVVSF